jgi:hypothetical protein
MNPAYQFNQALREREGSTPEKARRAVDALNSDEGRHLASTMASLLLTAPGGREAYYLLSKRSNRRAWLGVNTMALKYDLSIRHASSIWNRLTPATQAALNKAADEVIVSLDVAETLGKKPYPAIKAGPSRANGRRKS